MKRMIAIAAGALLLAACGQNKPLPPPDLTPPRPELMMAPEALEPIPKCEAEVRCRIKHYAAVRAQYGRLADRTRGLQVYVRELRL